MTRRVSSSQLAKFGKARAKVKTIKAQLGSAERTANALARLVGKAPKKKRKKSKKSRKKARKSRKKSRR